MSYNKKFGVEITPSPFATRNRKAKLAYCVRTATLMQEWYAATREPVFRAEVQLWKSRYGWVTEGKL